MSEYIRKSNLTLKESIEEFLIHCDIDRGLSPHTIKAYRLDLIRYKKFCRRVKLHQSVPLDHNLIRAYLRELNCFKPRTKNRRLASLKSYYRFLEDEEIISSNPMDRIRKRARVPKQLPRTITRSEAARILTHLHDQKRKSDSCFKALRDSVIIETLFNTGMRVGELCRLKIDDLFLDEGFVFVRGKGDKERTIPICGESYRSLLEEFLAEVGKLDYQGEYLFLNRDLNRLTEQSVRRIVSKYADSTNIKGLTPHVFRHSIATLLLEEGTDIRYIQKFLGHSSIVTTTIYASVRDKAHRDIIQSNHPRDMIMCR